MPTRNVHLTDHFDQFIADGITSGHFSDASEIVREGLRLLEQRQHEDRARIEWLCAAAREGFDAIERGDCVTLDSGEELDAFMKEIHQEVAADLAVERDRA